MTPFERFKAAIRKEAIALAALCLAALSFVADREVFQRWWRTEPTITTYHVLNSEGRCPVAAFEIENRSNAPVANLRLTIEEDWITRRGDDAILIETFESAGIAPREATVMPRRPPLTIETLIQGNVFVVPLLMPGDYVQRLVFRERSPAMARAREALADDPRTRSLPRIARATYDGGQLTVGRIGACLSAA